MPKKMQRSALRSGLSSRLAEGAIIALDEFAMPEPRTREMASAIDKLGLTGQVLVVDTSFEDNAYLSARNIQNLEMRDADSLNLLDVLKPERLVFTRVAIEAVDKRLAGKIR